MSNPDSFREYMASLNERFAEQRGAISVPSPKPRHAADKQLENASRIVGIPAGFDWARLDHPDLKERVGRPRAISEALAILEHTAPAPSLVFRGPSGHGKTSLAVALMRHWADGGERRRAAFVPAYRLGVARAQHGLGAGEPAEVERAMNVELLVLDDVGTERQTTMNAVPDVLFERAYAGRITWVTTWLSPADASKMYGDGIARRIFERSKQVDCQRPPTHDPRGGPDS